MAGIPIGFLPDLQYAIHPFSPGIFNFLTYSFDGYTKAYYQAEVMEDIYDDDKSLYESIKVHLIALTLFFRDDGNILYIGILLVFLSIIIYLVNITTS